MLVEGRDYIIEEDKPESSRKSVVDPGPRR